MLTGDISCINFPKKSDYPDSETSKITDNSLDEEETISTYKNTMCPVCRHNTVEVVCTYKYYEAMNVDYYSGAHVSAHCCFIDDSSSSENDEKNNDKNDDDDDDDDDGCGWRAYIYVYDSYTSYHAVNSNWDLYIQAWYEVYNIMSEIRNKHKLHKEKKYWYLKENISTPICVMCHSTDIDIFDEDDYNYVSCNKCNWFWQNNDDPFEDYDFVRMLSIDVEEDIPNFRKKDNKWNRIVKFGGSSTNEYSLNNPKILQIHNIEPIKT